MVEVFLSRTERHFECIAEDQLLAVQLPLTIALAWMAYRLVGRTLYSVVMASAYFGFMLGTMANSLAAMDELQRRYGPSPRAFLVIPLAGGVLSDFANLFAIVLSRALFAGGQ